ncbi:hypothetical protein [Chromatium okenii]|uniref:hypothetical protein n=1 Tax=Chromatium okenii TaxID=61644 RepID=UPI001F5BC363|nr:hypothetical protein [Chromatium okenii]
MTAPNTHTLPAAIQATRHDFNSASAGRIHYYADTSASGRPLLLIHSINAAPRPLK